jgi:hypothetical protein
VLTWGVVVAVVVAAAWVALVARAVLGRRRGTRPRAGDPDRTATTVTLALVLGTALVGAAFFGLVTSLDPNPRYSLATQVLLVAVPLTLLLPDAVSRRPRGTRAAGSSSPDPR